MIHAFLRSMSAVAILLVGSSIASAFPVVNKVQTTSGGGGLSGSVTYRINNTSTTRSGILAKQFTTTTTAGDFNQDSSIFYAQITPTTTYKTYCIEVTETLVPGSITTVIDRIPPKNVDPLQNPLLVNTPSAEAMQRAAWVIRYGKQLVGGSNQEQEAAIQLAIWEIVYDAGIQNGNVTALSGANGFKVNGGYTATAIANAQTLLDLSYNGGNVKQHDGLGFYQNVTLDPSGLASVRLDSGQNVLAAVPEPSTFAIAGLSGLAMLGYGLRRRKMARA